KRSWELRNNAFARRPDARTDKMALDENADAARLDAKSYVLHLDRSNRAARTADFADLPNHDYHPAENSALIDRGTNLPHVKTDREGTARPQGAAHDVGAYERVRGDASQ